MQDQAQVRHIDENLALQFVEGLLSAEHEQQIETHVASCGPCARLLADASELWADGTARTAPTWRVDRPAKRAPGELPHVGDVLDDTYVLERYLGRGGMGVVFEASHRRLPRRFAVKVLARSLFSDSTAAARIQREAHIASRLSHPHLVQVIDFNASSGGTLYVVMELLEGRSLADTIQTTPPPYELSFVLPLMRQITSALAAAHAAGVVHRDLKPSNIFLCAQPDGGLQAKVLDFGVSKDFGATDDLTWETELVGTPRYMAPEQAMGRSKTVDERSDIFSLGVILFELLCGRSPFHGETVPETLYRVAHGAPRGGDSWPSVYGPLKEVALAALQKEPARRPASMQELWQSLATAAVAAGFSLETPGTTTSLSLSGLGSSVRLPRGRPTRRWFARHSLAIGGVAIALAALSSLWLAPRAPEVTERAAGRPGSSANAWQDSRSAALPAIREPVAESSAGRAPEKQDARSDRQGVLAATTGRARTRTSRRPLRGPTQPRGRSSLASAPAKLPAKLAAAAALPAPADTGELALQTTVDGRYHWAFVAIDGEPVGQTPLTRKLAAGWHTVHVYREGYAPTHRRVWVSAGTRVRITLDLTTKQGPAAVPRDS